MRCAVHYDDGSEEVTRPFEEEYGREEERKMPRAA